jgi:hypothetical protein
MGKNNSYTSRALIIVLIIFGPIYLIELLHIEAFSTTKLFNIPIGGFIIWIYYLVVALVALVLVSMINASERN